MEPVSQPDDFFQAFLHSLRASCFQFVDFRDHVNIRGFISVEVDGANHRHLVLAEKVARGTASVTASFPLKSLPCDLDKTTNAEQSPQRVRPPNPTRQIGICPPLNSTRRDTSHRSQLVKTRLNCKPAVNSPRRCTMQGTRCESNNTTFTLETSSKLTKLSSDTNNRLTPKRHISSETVDVSPSRSMLHNQDIKSYPINGTRSQSDISDSSSGTEVENTPQKRCGVLSTRKRSHISSANSPYNDSPRRPNISMSIDDISPTSFPDAIRMKSMAYKESRRKRDKHGKKSKQQVNRERAKANRDLTTQRRTLLQPFACLVESDQEYNITSTKQPYYLVNLADDVITTPNIVDGLSEGM